MSIETAQCAKAKPPSRMSAINSILDEITKQLEELDSDVTNLESNLVGDCPPVGSGKECKERGSGNFGRILVALDRHSTQIKEIHTTVKTIMGDCS